jgi:peptidoglycan-associated lipoprotein
MFVLFVLACIKPPPVDPVLSDPSAVVAVPASARPAGESDAVAVAVLRENFQRVHFELDSDRLSEGARDALAVNAAVLKRHARIEVEVQGHADDRGTTEYNLALGQRRADAVVGALRSMGVPQARLTVVSLGEERPLAVGDDETVWAENRRAEFRVLVDDGAVAGTVAR